MKWISVKQELPPDFKDVLVYCTATEYGTLVGWCKATEWRVRFTEGSGAKNVTHWMPLPEAPDEV